jgi:hypothetical protein
MYLLHEFFLLDGLGQLTDGILAGDDYHLTDNVQGIGKTGYDWIGWKRRPPSTSNINILFQFDTLRNLTSIRLHTSNLFTRDIYLFHSIMITNCEDNISKTFLIINDDIINTQARFINISLASGQGILTKCLKIILTFNNRSKWILISEIIFDSMPIINNTPLITTTYIPPLIGKRYLVFVLFKISNIYVDEGVSIAQYWHWLLLATSLLILLIVLLIFGYIQWIQTYRHRRKLRK